MASAMMERSEPAEVMIEASKTWTDEPAADFLHQHQHLGKHFIFQVTRNAELFVSILMEYRQQNKYLLHEFVLMPYHFHLLITPAETIERAMQLIKGGFSYRAKKELGKAGEIWQRGFTDRRVRDAEEYAGFRKYIHENPVKAGLCRTPEEYPYSSAGRPLDDVPQRLKPGKS